MTKKKRDGITLILEAMFPGVEEEVKFHPTRKWRVDWLWKKEKIALELEGGIWSGGAHGRPVGIMRDIEKYNELAIAGYMLIRVTTGMMKNGEATILLERAFAARRV